MAHNSHDSGDTGCHNKRPCAACGTPSAETASDGQQVCRRCIAKANRRAIAILGTLFIGCLFLLFGLPLVSRQLSEGIPVWLLYPAAGIMLLVGIGTSLFNCWRGTASRTEQRAAYMGCIAMIAIAFNFIQQYRRPVPEHPVLNQSDKDQVAPLQLLSTPGTYFNKAGHRLTVSADPIDGIIFRLAVRDVETEWTCSGEWLLTWDEADVLWFADMDQGIRRVNLRGAEFVASDCVEQGDCSDVPDGFLKELPDWFIEVYGSNAPDTGSSRK